MASNHSEEHGVLVLFHTYSPTSVFDSLNVSSSGHSEPSCYWFTCKHVLAIFDRRYWYQSFTLHVLPVCCAKSNRQHDFSTHARSAQHRMLQHIACRVYICKGKDAEPCPAVLALNGQCKHSVSVIWPVWCGQHSPCGQKILWWVVSMCSMCFFMDYVYFRF